MARKTETFKHTKVDLVGLGCALLILGAAVWFGVRPIFRVEDVTRRLENQMTNSKTQLQEAQNEYRELRSSIAFKRAELDALALSLDDSDQLAARQAGIGEVFESCNVVVEGFSVGSLQPGELVDALTLSVTGRGTSADVVHAMYALRKRFPDIAVTAFQISRSPRGDQLLVSFSFDLAWYVVSDDAAGA